MQKTAYAVHAFAVHAYAIQKVEDMDNLTLVHHRMAHISPAICETLNDHTHGLPTIRLTDKERRQALHELCQSCGIMKSNRLPARRLLEDKAPEKWGDLVSTDLHGPLPPSYGEKYIYAICFVDHYTGYTEIYGMREKTAAEASACLRTFLSDTSKFGIVQSLLSDGGGEYMRELQEICDHNYIKQIKSAAYYHDGNSRAERMWQLLTKNNICGR